MKGIILAGGSGSRLHPATVAVSKQLLPIYTQPLIYFPLSTLMMNDVREILIITTQTDLPLFQRLLRDGRHLGLSFEYVVQDRPNGIAEAFILGERFIGSDGVWLILGDNIFHGIGEHVMRDDVANVFAYHVKDPRQYGVVELDDEGRPISIEEKPQHPKSHLAVTGLYYYPNSVVHMAKTLKPSARGELEITDINREYMVQGNLNVIIMNRGSAWLDTGTPESIMEAANYIQAIEKRQGLKIGCPEEIAWGKGWITTEQLIKLYGPTTSYGQYLRRLAEG